MGRILNKVAVVTGAASRLGIGRAVATMFRAEGAAVVVTDREVIMGRQAAEEIGNGVIFLEHDVRNESSWQSMMSEVISRFGRLDILVNNAGITRMQAQEDIESVTLDNWRAVQAVNVEGVLLGCKWAIRAMKRSGGSIINISSMAALTGTPSLPAYGASKAAVRQITQTVALHCARNGYGIRCNSIHPGVIRTDILDGAFSEEAMARLFQSIPTGEFGQPSDVAAAALYLASDDSRYVTGTRLVVDGGVTMQ